MLTSLSRDEGNFFLDRPPLRRPGAFLESRIDSCIPRDLEPDVLYFRRDGSLYMDFLHPSRDRSLWNIIGLR